MTSNYREFALALDRFADKTVPEQVQAVAQKVALQALSGVVLKTPVDTGAARASWQTTLEVPAAGQADGVDPSGGATIQKGADVIQSLRPYGAVWISSNLPYIVRLEEGYSQQAPSGMVALTVQEIRVQFGGLI